MTIGPRWRSIPVSSSPFEGRQASGLGSTISFPHSIAHRISRLDRYMPGRRLAGWNDNGPIEVVDLAVGEMDADGRVAQHTDDETEQTPLDLLAFGRLIADGSTIMARAVLHVGNAAPFSATSGADGEDALVGEAASAEIAGYEDDGSLIHEGLRLNNG
jgi:hypothetical protein